MKIGRQSIVQMLFRIGNAISFYLVSNQLASVGFFKKKLTSISDI